MKVTKHEPGKFCWVDLNTSSSVGAKEFYCKLMGWEYEDAPMGEGMVYTTFTLGGERVAAMFEDSFSSAPPHWNSYICVDDIEAVTAKSVALGAVVRMEPMEVMGHGKMSSISDPTGALVSFWQPQTHTGYTLVNEPCAICWNELSTNNVAVAEKFYSELLGYGVKHSMMTGPYVELQVEGKSVAGITEMESELKEAPSYWGVYYTVGNCKETVAKAESLGATVLIHPREVPGVGVWAMIKDPQGAIFAIMA